ncbi:PREDICTED: B3 domain-containing transcription factor VRN1 [Theobroma cacao]|uniref:B3 domain-containing transcription factor VRN1 n=1 Tax=Theobroma cacao TaxID=3641 RepID=A0AB32VUD0_THECC|nr:PREDICTED: B3 domain-containing transcription factor VRN1 [Theobroma cacao]
MQSQGMLPKCQNCRMMEKHKYWKEFQSNRHQFFKIMIGDSRNQLRIPRKFMSNFRENLSGTVYLRGPSGFMWAVEVERMFDDVVFGNGWQNFVKDHSLADADFVVFRYDGNSTFNVVIFDLSGCEREGSYFVKKHTSACSNGRCGFRREDGEGSEEVIDLDKVHENHMQKEKLTKGKGNTISKAVDTICQLKATQEKHLRVGKSAIASEVIEILMDESEESSGSATEASEDWSNNSVSLKCKSKKKEVGCLTNDSGKMKRPLDLPGSYNLYFISNRRKITEEEKQRPRRLAKQYSSTRPSFSIVMKPTHVCKAFTVNIREKWLDMHVPDKVRIALLRVAPDEKRWPVRIMRTKWRRGFARGWGKFVLDNNLEEHDVCVFELNEEGQANKKSIGFNVVIFRVLDEIVPLTRFSNTQPNASD